MKKVAYLIYVPLIAIGFIAGTIAIGVNGGFHLALDFWENV